MKYLSAISAVLFLAINATAMASTTELDVIYSPFSEGVAKLSVPALTECESSGTTLTIVKCLTPGATLDLGGLREIVIENVSTLSGRSGDITYSDEIYIGFMMVNGAQVSVRVTLPTRNGSKFPGSLDFTKDQAFTVVPR